MKVKKWVRPFLSRRKINGKWKYFRVRGHYTTIKIEVKEDNKIKDV